jgi:hypothetical protein
MTLDITDYIRHEFIDARRIYDEFEQVEHRSMNFKEFFAKIYVPKFAQSYHDYYFGQRHRAHYTREAVR